MKFKCIILTSIFSNQTNVQNGNVTEGTHEKKQNIDSGWSELSGF